MSGVRDEGELDEVDFSWGLKNGMGDKNGEVQLYYSFTYDGVEYFLYDSVYLFKEGEPEPYIGKLIQIFEHPNKERKVKVLWYFRSSEVSVFLGDENVLDKELFLATGCGRGLTNINPLEAIAGKCNVVCISNDQRNPQPSIEEVKAAHFVFHRTFDVQYRTISDTLGETIATVKVDYLLNNNDFLLSNHAKLDSGNLVVSIENPLTSVQDSRVANKAVENDDFVGSLTSNDNDGAKDILDRSKYDPPKNREDAQRNGTGLIKGPKNNLVSNKDDVGTDENVLCDAGVGSLLVKDDQGTNKKDDATRPYKTGSMDLSASMKGSQSTGVAAETKVKGKIEKFVNPLDEKANNLGLKPDDDCGKGNGSGSVPSTTGSDKGKTELKMGIGSHAVRKLKSVNNYGALEERPSKKHKHNGIAPIPRDDGGIITQNSATVSAANNKASQSAGAAAKTNDKGQMGKQLVGTSSSIPRMLKSSSITENKSVGKLHKLSSKQPKDLETYTIASSASKIVSQPVGAAIETSDRSQLDRGTSHGLPKKLKSIGTIEEKSSDKVCKAVVPKDVRKSAFASSMSNKSPQCTRVDGVKLAMGLEGTKDGRSKLKSNVMVEEKSNVKLHRAPIKQSKDSEAQAYGRLKEVTQRPPGKRKWVQASCVPWEEIMKEARNQGILVQLLNLDPTYTSLEVENIVWHGLGCGCMAKMVPRTAISSPHSGQAFAIFKTPEAAKKIITKLGVECLMLPNGRPLVGISGGSSFSGKQSSFPGHLVIDKLKHQMSRNAREAVSTSHPSQPNNIEYEMAIDWRILQERSNLWWKTLHKNQREEIQKLKARLKIK